MRQLASIQEVASKERIPKADAIERLRVLGWWVVAKKDEYQVGDRIVYCEIDSLLPEKQEFEFLRSSSFKPAVVENGEEIQRAGFRVKTVKLRGQVSQGICFPLSILPEGASTDLGTDVTDALEIVKYEPPVPVGMGGKIKGTFPAFISKTDEIRVQTVQEYLQKYSGEKFTITEKLDGTSFTAFVREGEFGICSRNYLIDETDRTNVLCRVAEELKLKEKLDECVEKFGADFAIQGEVVGPGIQGNKYQLSKVELFVFNIFNINEFKLVDREQQVEMLECSGLQGVPILDDIEFDHSVDELVELSKGTSVLNKNTIREGVVFRTQSEITDPDFGGRLGFKVINPRFLLKFDE